MSIGTEADLSRCTADLQRRSAIFEICEDGRMSERPPAEGEIPPEPNASDRPHDVLAAEQFAMPAPQAAWHPQAPPELPPEPNASDRPHDVLAAEEFAMPAPPPHVEFASPPMVRGASDEVIAHVAPHGFALAHVLRRWRDRRRMRAEG